MKRTVSVWYLLLVLLAAWAPWLMGQMSTSGPIAPLLGAYIVQVGTGANAVLTNRRVLTGTANQLTVTDGGAGGNITLSTPQNTDTAATPQFASLRVNTATAPASGNVMVANVASFSGLTSGGVETGLLGVNANNTVIVHGVEAALADSATRTIVANSNNGFYVVWNNSDGWACMFHLRDGVLAPVLVSEPVGGTCSITVDTASRLNVYATGGNYVVQNKLGVSKSIGVVGIGR